MPLSIIIGPGN
jgi:transposase